MMGWLVTSAKKICSQFVANFFYSGTQNNALVMQEVHYSH